MAGNPDLIDEYRKMHATRLYGSTSVKNLRYLRPEISLLKPRSILDYGCGQSPLLEALDLGYPVKLLRYDPAIPRYAELPKAPVDLLINVDVLEHIEEDDLDTVLAQMASLSRDALIIVDTKPAEALLSDGRNAHVSLHPHGWWHDRLQRHFPRLHPIETVRRSRAGFRTWDRSGLNTLRYAGLRAVEDVRHYAARLKNAAVPRRSANGTPSP